MEHADARIQRLLEAVLAVAEGRDLDSVLEQVVVAACGLVDAQFGALGVLDATGERLAAFVHHGMDPDAVARLGPLPTGRGLLGELMRHPQPLRLADLSVHPAAVGLPAGHPPMRSFIGTPIRVNGEVFGNLYLTEKLGAEDFDADDEGAVVALAAVAGSAIANARLSERSSELTLSRERDRIARDLHDTVIQNLFATGLQLNAVERALRQGADVSQGIDDAIASIDRIVKEIRSTIFALSDDDRTVGPRSRLVGVVEEMSSVLGFTARMRFEGPVDTALEPSLTEQAVPVLRETLTNVAKHARAGQVEVRVRVGEGRLDIEVVDDGVGLPAGTGRAGGFGLRNLTERAESLGGSARFESVPGRGARVLWSVPLTGV